MAVLHSSCLCLHLQAPLSTHLRKFILLFFYCFLTHSRFPSVTSTSLLSPSLCAASPPFVNTPLFVDTPPLSTPHPLHQPFIPASYSCVDVPATACEFFFLFFVLPLLTAVSPIPSCRISTHTCCTLHQCPFPGLSQPHRRPDLCAWHQMPVAMSRPLQCVLRQHSHAHTMPAPPSRTPSPRLLHLGLTASAYSIRIRLDCKGNRIRLDCKGNRIRCCMIRLDCKYNVSR